MPIDITCTGCRTRFSVSDKFAGKKGPCPKCKTVIQIPEKSDEVVVHAPEEFGPKNASGVGVLKPIARREVKTTPLMWVGIGSGIVLVLVGALLLRGMESVPPFLIGLMAFLLGPPLVLAGYSFLQDDGLEAYRGKSLWIRTLICSVVYAVLWGVFTWVPGYMFNLETLELFHLIIVIPPLAFLGGLAAFAALDLDFGTALMHYGLYVLVTMGLAVIVGLPLLGTAAASP